MIDFQEAHLFLDSAQQQIKDLESRVAELVAENEELRARPAALDPSVIAAAVTEVLTRQTGKPPLATVPPPATPPTQARYAAPHGRVLQPVRRRPIPETEVSHARPEPEAKPESEAKPEPPKAEEKVTGRAKPKYQNVSEEKVEAARPKVLQMGKFTGTELANKLGFTNSATVYPYINAFLSDDTIERIGEKGKRGTYYVVREGAKRAEVVEASPKVPAPPKPSKDGEDAQVAPDTGAPAKTGLYTLARDWVVTQKEGDAFSNHNLAEATKMSPHEAKLALKALAERDIVRLELETTDMFLCSYQKPKAPGRAAELDREASKAHNKGGNGQGAAPVPGTGRGPQAAHKGTQEIIDAAVNRFGRAPNGKPTVVPLGSGHYAIHGENGARVIIGGTPNNAGLEKDRNRAKQTLGLKL